MAREKLAPIRLEGYQPLRDVVFEALLSAIMSGALPPGERLMEVALSEEMGISRTPVREAIRRLELEGFVIMIPRKGAYVSGLSIRDVENVFELRSSLEILATSLAAERVTDEEIAKLEELHAQLIKEVESKNSGSWVELDCKFHEIIYIATRNDRLIQIMSNLFEQINRYRVISLSQPDMREGTLHEHENLIKAIKTRDIEAAKEYAYEHIQNTEEGLLTILQDKLQ